MSVNAAGKHMGDRAVDFEKETGIKVSMIEVEWDTMVNRQLAALTARKPTFDIVGCGTVMISKYVQGGLYDDISDLFPPEHKAKYIDGIVEAVTIDGRIYAAPLMASWAVMFYNSVLFEEAGIRKGPGARDYPRYCGLTCPRRVYYGRVLQVGKVGRRPDPRVERR
jgi:ABC-type glycerol-3-phosphate transport system substrate-binding protein